MIDEEKEALMYKVTTVIFMVLFAVATIYAIMLSHSVSPAPTIIQYNNTTTVQCNCYEQPKVNCSTVEQEVKENINDSYVSTVTSDWDSATYWSGYHSSNTTTPIQTPLSTPEFPFLPIH